MSAVTEKDEDFRCSSPVVRDSYGFEVSREYVDLYNAHAPVWKREEQSRLDAWRTFLHTHNADVTESSDDSDVDLLADAAERLLAVSTSSFLGQEVHELIRTGLPFALRGKFWKVLLRIRARKVDGLYEQLVEGSLGELESKKYLQSEDLRDRVTSLLTKMNNGTSVPYERSSSDGIHRFPEESSSSKSSISVKAWNPNAKNWLSQIEKDLHRTFPGHQLMDKSGRCALRRILAAYALHNPAVGYCQGMNFLAGTLLLFMDEEDAFWCLGSIAEDMLPGYYSLAMISPQVDQRVFKHLITEQLPTLTTHLTNLGVDISCIFTQWFLCCFINILPLETCLRVWDVLFFERNSVVLFRVGLALFDIFSAALLATDDLLDACELLQSMAPMSYGSSEVIDVACTTYGHLTGEMLNRLRARYRGDVLKEVERGPVGRRFGPSLTIQRRLQHEIQDPGSSSMDQEQRGAKAGDDASAAGGWWAEHASGQRDALPGSLPTFCTRG